MTMPGPDAIAVLTNRLGQNLAGTARAQADALARLAVQRGLEAEHDNEFVGYTVWCLIKALERVREGTLE